MYYRGKLWTPTDEHNKNSSEQQQAEKLASLTPQQHKILHMFADGLLNKQIAYELNLSESTIKSHASTIYFKTGCKKSHSGGYFIKRAANSPGSTFPFSPPLTIIIFF